MGASRRLNRSPAHGHLEKPKQPQPSQPPQANTAVSGQ
eukprot:CAMPEP_0204344816 /NCGR_PEP_ID=MMETSP0469-20131031/25908_1 /ASSEMBLY_ACC=CAM_ASM_000384 /TAXON_ID=2969 /ORGANISM="Oxyrrhis marina" /LENGTH=37 /DNA_ID= /DNA_START= /DNA_END= /DNA_ORIENTATION=